MSNIIMKPIAQTEKCFLDESVHDKADYSKGSALLGELTATVRAAGW